MSQIEIVIAAVAAVIGILVGFAVGFVYRKNIAEAKVGVAETRAEKIEKLCKIYNKDYHLARFALPNFVKELVK